MKRIYWTIDPMHSEISFKVKHLMLTTVTGRFKSFTGEAITGNEEFNHTTDIKLSVDVDSLSTNNPQRDNHLKSPDFFDAAHYPELKFNANSFNASTGKLIGDLTIRDITRRVTLDSEFSGIAFDPIGQKKTGFSLSGKISRKEFGLHWNALTETGGVVVGDEVKIIAEIQFAQASVVGEETAEEMAQEN